MSKSVDIIIDELAVAAAEQGINCDDLAERVRSAAYEEDVNSSGETE